MFNVLFEASPPFILSERYVFLTSKFILNNEAKGKVRDCNTVLCSLSRGSASNHEWWRVGVRETELFADVGGSACQKEV